jgi:hypothetical protein
MNPKQELWKKCSPATYFENIKIPDTWDSIESFTNWYLEQRMPLMIPWDAEVIRTDDATAICIFRKPPYQVELYLIHPGLSVAKHAHPGMEVITMTLGGGKIDTKSVTNTSTCWGDISENLKNGEFHGGQPILKKTLGFGLMSFEKWPANVPMTSAAIHWVGETAGVVHDKLISSHHPGAVLHDGYANISQNNNT